MFKGRTVVEIMILVFSFTVAIGICAIGSAIIIIEINNPGADTGRASDAILALMSAILGALLGLIAGKNDSPTPFSTPFPPPPPEDKSNDKSLN